MRRAKSFTLPDDYVITREDKARLMTLARALLRRTERGRAYGAVTAKALAVFEALLFTFANAKTGRCFPSYERLAEAAGCARSTVARVIKLLEGCRLLRWINRIERRRIAGEVRVVRTSNAYDFPLIEKRKLSKSDLRPGTSNQVLSIQAEPQNFGLEEALARFARLREARERGLARAG